MSWGVQGTLTDYVICSIDRKIMIVKTTIPALILMHRTFSSKVMRIPPTLEPVPSATAAAGENVLTLQRAVFDKQQVFVPAQLSLVELTTLINQEFSARQAEFSDSRVVAEGAVAKMVTKVCGVLQNETNVSHSRSAAVNLGLTEDLQKAGQIKVPEQQLAWS